MLTHHHAEDAAHPHHHHGQAAGRLLLWVLLGTAFVVNGYLARWLFPDDEVIGHVSACVGALMLFLPILRTAIADLLAGHVHMNELVALAVLASMAQGDFHTAGVVSFFMLISLVIETRTAEGAHAAIEKLVRLTPQTARRLHADGREIEIAASALSPADRLRVLPGEYIPADGLIESGRTTLNEAAITGESVPRDKGPGEEVFAGTLNLTGALVVQVQRVGVDTTLGHVRQMILAAEQTRLPLMRIIDRYAGCYTPVVLMLAGLVWFFTGDWGRVIALLVIACPCALILATPTAMVAALSAAARMGILIKNVQDLEGVARLNAVVFDKTGTLTHGRLSVARLAPAEGVSPSVLLETAAAAERFSRHPAAVALLELAAETHLAVTEPGDFHEEAGQGVRATVAGEPVCSGRAGWLRSQGVADARLDEADRSQAEGYSAIFVARDGRYLGWIGFADRLREEAAESFRDLAGLQIKRLAMITGDRQAVAQRVAAELGCRELRAECLPQEKVAFVNAVKRDGYRVAFVGDGVNDAPALAASDTGIAMGAAGNDVAIHSAAVALMSNDLRRLPTLIRLSRRARAVIYQNLAVGGLFILGGFALSGLGLLTPVWAALFHNAGSLVVVFNSARLIRLGEPTETDHAESD